MNLRLKQLQTYNDGDFNDLIEHENMRRDRKVGLSKTSIYFFAVRPETSPDGTGPMVPWGPVNFVPATSAGQFLIGGLEHGFYFPIYWEQ